MRNSASLVSPCSLRQVPPRTARVAGRHLAVIERSVPVVRFMMCAAVRAVRKRRKSIATL
ncbi:hypothetical protein GCM10023306_19670 [Novosphingobium ginsenosidimutans]